VRQLKAQYLPPTQDLFQNAATKSQAQQIKIVQAAIKSFAHHGIEKTSYTNLAKDCGISRTLIHHYFPTLDSLFLLGANYARQTLLECAAEGLRRHPSDERKQLNGYIHGCFRWVELFPDQAKFWMLYFYQSSLGGTAKSENTAMVRAGHQRIQALILTGKEKGYFHFKDAALTSKAIQVLITGAIVTIITENDYLSLKNVTHDIQETVAKLLS
jgi:AcrR family transcriptional regulator